MKKPKPLPTTAIIVIQLYRGRSVCMKSNITYITPGISAELVRNTLLAEAHVLAPKPATDDDDWNLVLLYDAAVSDLILLLQNDGDQPADQVLKAAKDRLHQLATQLGHCVSGGTYAESTQSVFGPALRLEDDLTKL